MNKHKIDEAFKSYTKGKISMGKAAEAANLTIWKFLDLLKENRPKPQWNWWSSGKLMNPEQMNNWYFTELKLERHIKNVRENPSYFNARSLVHTSCDISEIYRRR